MEGMLTPIGVNNVGLFRQLPVQVKSTCALAGFAEIRIIDKSAVKLIVKTLFFITDRFNIMLSKSIFNTNANFIYMKLFPTKCMFN